MEYDGAEPVDKNATAMVPATAASSDLSLLGKSTGQEGGWRMTRFQE